MGTNKDDGASPDGGPGWYLIISMEVNVAALTLMLRIPICLYE
jgi:hypothetical protein